MAAVSRRGPDPLPRALAVVALVAVAALALQARQGLDWDSLAEPLDVRWSRLVVTAVLLAGLVGIGRRLLRRLRRPSVPRSSDDDVVEPEGEPFPWYLRALAVVLVLATMAVVFSLLSSLGPIPRPAPPPVAGPSVSGPQGPDASRVLGAGGTSPVLLVVVGALLVAAVASRWNSRRRPEQEVEGFGERAAVRRLARAVDAAEQELGRHADPRAAVLAAYAVMSRHLGTGLVHRGGALPGSDTATELLERSVSAGLVSGDPAGPARTLTELFREARFSSHPMGEPARHTAEESLRQVRAELGARRG